MFPRVRPASARAELKSTLLTLLGKCQKPGFRATSFYLKARKVKSEIGTLSVLSVSQLLKIQAALAYTFDRNGQDPPGRIQLFPRSLARFLDPGIRVISARH